MSTPSAFTAWQQVIRACQPLDAACKVNVLLASAFMLGVEDELARALNLQPFSSASNASAAVLTRQAAAELVDDEAHRDGPDRD